MKRRGFFRALFALPVAAAGAAVAAALPEPKPVLRSGRIGRIEGFSFYESPKFSYPSTAKWTNVSEYDAGKGRDVTFITFRRQEPVKGFLRG